jgi:hypothetical protein
VRSHKVKRGYLIMDIMGSIKENHPFAPETGFDQIISQNAWLLTRFDGTRYYPISGLGYPRDITNITITPPTASRQTLYLKSFTGNQQDLNPGQINITFENTTAHINYNPTSISIYSPVSNTTNERFGVSLNPPAPSKHHARLRDKSKASSSKASSSKASTGHQEPPFFTLDVTSPAGIEKFRMTSQDTDADLFSIFSGNDVTTPVTRDNSNNVVIRAQQWVPEEAEEPLQDVNLNVEDLAFRYGPHDPSHEPF